MAVSTSTGFAWNGQSLAVQLEAAFEQAVDETGAAIVEVAQSLAVVKTGAFRDGIVYHLDRTSHGATAVIEATAGHSTYVIFGTARMPARDPIRPAVDREAPKLPERLRANVAGIR